MSMRITMLQTRMGEAGSLLTSGSTYTVGDAFGRAMIGAGYASDTDLQARTELLRPQRALVTAIGDSLMSGYAAVTTSAVSRTGSTVTLTATGHGLFPGARIRIDGLDTFDTSLRGIWTIASYVDANNVTFACPGAVQGALTRGSTMRVYNMQRRASDSFLVWAQILGNQALELAEVFNCSGRRTSDMLQFVASAAATGASYCHVLGGTNDIMGVGGSALLAPEILRNLRAVHDGLLAVGVRPIIWTVPPATGTSWSAARAKVIAQVNEGLRADCRRDARRILADISATLVDPVSGSQGSAKANYFLTNDVHPTTRGAYYGGKKIAAAVTAAIPAVDVRVLNNSDNRGFDTDSTNILDAAPWTNSGGTVSGPVTGTIAAGWVAERSGTCAGVASIPARADGYGYDLTIAATPAAASDGVNIRTAGSTWQSRVVAGRAYETLMSVSLSGLSGSTLQYAMFHHNGTVDGVSITYLSSGLYPAEATAPDENWSGVVSCPPMTINGVLTSANLYNTVNFTGSGTAVTMAVGRVSIREF